MKQSENRRGVDDDKLAAADSETRKSEAVDGLWKMTWR